MTQADHVAVLAIHPHHTLALAHCLDRPQLIAIGRRLGPRNYRRNKVRHDDGPGKLSRSEGHDAFELSTITYVQMPIIGAGNRQSLHEVGGKTARRQE